MERPVPAMAGMAAEPGDALPGEALSQLLSVPAIEGTIQSSLQELEAQGRCPKTLGWHRIALGGFQHYLITERYLLLLIQVTQAYVQGWVTNLRRTQTPTEATRLDMNTREFHYPTRLRVGS